MGEVYFVRHGQASFGAANYDKLSDLGHQQSDWLGQHLAQNYGPFDHVVTGALTRHRETFAGIAKHLGPLDVEEDPRLNEMSYLTMERSYAAKTGEQMPGNVRGLERHFTKVMKAWQADAIPDAPEVFSTFQNRILEAFHERARHQKRVLVVSSGGPVGILMRNVLGLDLAAMTEVILGTYNASVTRFSVLDDKIRLMQFNAVPHLEQPGRDHALTFL